MPSLLRSFSTFSSPEHHLKIYEKELSSEERFLFEGVDTLYSSQSYKKAIDLFAKKNYKEAQKLFEKSLDELHQINKDYPNLLTIVYEKLAICNSEQGDTSSLKETLQELFLINSADPTAKPSQKFVSTFNFIVYLMKNEPKNALAISKKRKELLNPMELPEVFKNELEFIFGVKNL